MTDESVPQASPIPGQPEGTQIHEPRHARTKVWRKQVNTWYHEHRFPVIASLIGLLILVLAVALGISLLNNNTNNGIAGKMEVPPQNPGPAYSDGVRSWTEFKNAADALDKDNVEGNIMYDSLHELHPEQGDIRQAVAAMVTLEKSGKTFLYTAPKGAAFINTDYKVSKNGGLEYRFFEDVTKNNTTTFLTFADGTVAVKAGCANAVRFHKNVPSGKKVVVKYPGRKKTPSKCDNNTGQYAKYAKQDPHQNVGSTPGYKRGTAEAVSKQQQGEPKGGTNPTPNGTPGTGSGGTTPGGSGSGAPVPNPGAGQTIGGTVPHP
jgi:hypothetical protein